MSALPHLRAPHVCLALASALFLVPPARADVYTDSTGDQAGSSSRQRSREEETGVAVRRRARSEEDPDDLEVVASGARGDSPSLRPGGPASGPDERESDPEDHP